jgi:hypothetical protein
MSEVRHHPNVLSLEIYNEQNVAQWWEGTIPEYARTLRTARAGVNAPPGFLLLAGGLVFPDSAWIEELCGSERASDAFDVLPVHAYPETWTPPDVTVENYLGDHFRQEFVPALDRSCGRKPIWINETGFATVPGKTEQDQAAWWARAVATFASEPRVEHIGVYEIKDLRPDRPAIGDAPNYHLGLTTVDRKPKLAFHTVKLLVDLLDGGAVIPLESSAIVERGASSSGELHHRYFQRRDGDGVLIVWNRSADETVTIRFPEGAKVGEFDLGGRVVQPERSVSSVDLRLRRGVPRILRIDPPAGRGSR